MDTIDLLRMIEELYHSFTKSERKVADFVLQNREKVIYMSITDLADSCGVCDSTVFRFCRTLKLGGYHQFRMLLAQSINSRTDGGELSAEEIGPQDDARNIAHKVLISGINSLRETSEMLDYTALNQAASMIASARRILFCGSGASGISAMDGVSRFMRILPNVAFTQDVHFQAISAALTGPEDLVIALTYSGSTKDTIQSLKIAKSTGSKTICITRYPKSPVVQYADVILRCASNEGPYEGGSLGGKLSQLYLLDLLYALYYRDHYDTMRKNREKTTAAIAEKLL